MIILYAWNFCVMLISRLLQLQRKFNPWKLELCLSECLSTHFFRERQWRWPLLSAAVSVVITSIRISGILCWCSLVPHTFFLGWRLLVRDYNPPKLEGRLQPLIYKRCSTEQLGNETTSTVGKTVNLKLEIRKIPTVCSRSACLWKKNTTVGHVPHTTSVCVEGVAAATPLFAAYSPIFSISLNLGRPDNVLHNHGISVCE